MTHSEGNKLISEFMGWRFIFDGNVMFLNQNTPAKPINKLEYHSSWDWLMPVVEKIESLDGGRGIYLVTIEGYYCSIKLHDETEWLVCEHSSKDSKIDAAWQTIVKFIQNEQIQSTSNQLE